MKKSSVFKIFTFLLAVLSANIFAFAGDGFVVVRTKSFHLVGAASEERIREEAFRLERFREAVRRAFPRINVDAPAVPTVLIFKDAESFAPFKPFGEDGRADKLVTGFFQSSDEASFIAFTAQGDGRKTSGTSYHEYFHFLIKNNFQTTALPVWLNEGLAEYFQTFRMKNDREAIFGEEHENHWRFLRKYKLLPLEKLFAVEYESLSKMDAETKSLFYAQSWLLVHYLMRTGGDAMIDRAKKFIALNAAGKTPDAAFAEAFKSSVAETGRELENYAANKSFKSNRVEFDKKLAFVTEFETERINESVWLEYLGDLLLQSQRYGAAEEILKRSLALDEKSARANLLLGKVFLRQGNRNDAAAYFEKAVALDGADYAARFFLADVLFRENVADDGYVSGVPKADARKIRELLKSAIAQNPRLIEAYRMLALISLANDDELDETIIYLQTALKIQPQNFRLEYNLAQILLRKKDFPNALKTAERLGANCIEKDFCERVKSFISALESIRQREKEIAELKKKYGLENVDFAEENLLPPAEILNRALNRSLRKPRENEKRFVGSLKEIDCAEKITFEIESENQNLKLSKPSFDGIMLISFSRNTAGMRIECGKPKTEMFVVATYKENGGELMVLEFVPREFRLIE